VTLVFDTSVLVDVERKNPRVLEQLQGLALKHPQTPAITFATFSEFYYGFLRKFPKKQKVALEELEKYKLLNTTASSAKVFAELKFALERTGNKLSLFDCLIASIVIDNNMTLVTGDKRFASVPTLRVITV